MTQSNPDQQLNKGELQGLVTFEVMASALAALFAQAMDYTLIEMKDMNPESEAARDTFIKEVLEKVRVKINDGILDEVQVMEKKAPTLYVPGE